MSGTATGVVNFINFTFSALLGPVFAGLLIRAAGEGGEARLVGVALAIVLTLSLKETGPAARSSA